MQLQASIEDFQTDLGIRWRPSELQVRMANAVISACQDYKCAYTVHVLQGKTQGFWTPSVQVIPLDGVFVSRAAALDYLTDQVGHLMIENPEISFSGGYTIHEKENHWSVFEAIIPFVRR